MHPLWTEWHTLVKTLPCPVFHMRAVINNICVWKLKLYNYILYYKELNNIWIYLVHFPDSTDIPRFSRVFRTKTFLCISESFLGILEQFKYIPLLPNIKYNLHCCFDKFIYFCWHIYFSKTQSKLTTIGWINCTVCRIYIPLRCNNNLIFTQFSSKVNNTKSEDYTHSILSCRSVPSIFTSTQIFFILAFIPVKENLKINVHEFFNTSRYHI